MPSPPPTNLSHPGEAFGDEGAQIELLVDTPDVLQSQFMLNILDSINSRLENIGKIAGDLRKEVAHAHGKAEERHLNARRLQLAM
jgi:hypothetical protein